MDKIKLPISTDEEPPRQLILRKNNAFVAAYDPVYRIDMNKDELIIIGFMDYEYRIKRSDIDKVEIINYKTDDILQTINMTHTCTNRCNDDKDCPACPHGKVGECGVCDGEENNEPKILTEEGEWY